MILSHIFFEACPSLTFSLIYFSAERERTELYLSAHNRLLSCLLASRGKIYLPISAHHLTVRKPRSYDDFVFYVCVCIHACTGAHTRSYMNPNRSMTYKAKFFSTQCCSFLFPLFSLHYLENFLSK